MEAQRIWAWSFGIAVALLGGFVSNACSSNSHAQGEPTPEGGASAASGASAGSGAAPLGGQGGAVAGGAGAGGGCPGGVCALAGAAGAASLGRAECPIVDGGCPTGCLPVRGEQADFERECFLPQELIACTTETGFSELASCVARVSDDAVFATSVIALQAEGHTSWRLCTTAELDALGWPSCS